jgi:hypothetical protein
MLEHGGASFEDQFPGDQPAPEPKSRVSEFAMHAGFLTPAGRWLSKTGGANRAKRAKKCGARHF